MVWQGVLAPGWHQSEMETRIVRSEEEKLVQRRSLYTSQGCLNGLVQHRDRGAVFN
jgi:hypothetical protein